MSTARRMPDARARRLSVRTTSVQDYFKKNPGRKAGVLCFQPEAETELRGVANSSPRQTHERRVLMMRITRARLSLCTRGFRGDVNAWTTAVRVSASLGLHPRVAQLRPLADQSRPVSLRVSRCVGARLRQVSPLPQFPHPPTHHGGGITRCGGLHRRDPEYSEVLIGRLNPVSIRLGVDSYAHMAPAACLA